MYMKIPWQITDPTNDDVFIILKLDKMSRITYYWNKYVFTQSKIYIIKINTRAKLIATS